MAERMLFAGMDVGTSGCKMLVYDLDGNIVYQSSRKYQEMCIRDRRSADLIMTACHNLQIFV